MKIELYLRIVSDELLRRQLPSGGWSTKRLAQAALEPTWLAAPVLRIRDETSLQAVLFLVQTQHRDGIWPAVHGDEETNWATTLALIAPARSTPVVRARDDQWLAGTRVRGRHWLWRWKFRTADRRARFDPDRYGWPWVPNTVSWVIQPSFSLIVLRQYCRTQLSEPMQSRVQNGMGMPLDLACHGDGWNAGSILDICATVPIHFVVADAVICMEGNGPLHGTARRLNTMVLADDPIAADVTCARLLILEPDHILHIREGSRFLGNNSDDAIQLGYGIQDQIEDAESEKSDE